jgi:hypothetical protein
MDLHLFTAFGAIGDTPVSATSVRISLLCRSCSGLSARKRFRRNALRRRGFLLHLRTQVYEMFPYGELTVHGSLEQSLAKVIGASIEDHEVTFR